MCRFCNIMAVVKDNQAAHDDFTQIAIGVLTMRSMLENLLLRPQGLTEAHIDDMRLCFTHVCEVFNDGAAYAEGIVQMAKNVHPGHLTDSFFTPTKTKGHL